MPSVAKRRKRENNFKVRRVGLKSPAARGLSVVALTARNPAARNWKTIAISATLLVLGTLALYAPVVGHPFVNYDDGPYVIFNSHVNSGLSWQNIKWAVTAVAVGNWHPVTWISHALDCQLFGLNATGHHLTSILLHSVNVLLLFLLLCKATGKIGRSWVVSALFAVHPFNVESVAWVAERKNLLCTFFFLLALAAYGWYAQKPGLKRYLAVAALFVLSLASKPMVVTFPFVLLLVDFWPLRRVQTWTMPLTAFPLPQMSLRKLMIEKLPLLALSLGSAIITVIAQRSADAIPSASVWPFSWRIENAIYGYAMYLWMGAFPHGLAPFYPCTLLSYRQVGLAALFLLALGFCVWKWGGGRPYLRIGFFWFLGTLVPVIGLVQVGAQARADRYAYIPLMGVFVAIVWLVAEAANSISLSVAWRSLAAALVLAVLCAVTYRQIGFWRNSAVLWTHSLQVTPDNFIAEENLGAILGDLGYEDEAFLHYQRAAIINPTDPNSLLNLGTNLMKHHRLDEAREKFETVLRTSKDPKWLATAYRGLGAASDLAGDRAEARKDFLRAMQLNPDSATDFYNLSLVEAEDNVDRMNQVLAAHPTAAGYAQLGSLLQTAHRFEDAQEAYGKALEMDPNLPAAKQALENMRASNGNAQR
jgi:protein O-mannosyl-transferase